MFKRFLRWILGPEHGSASWDGYYETCYCGYSSNRDPFLTTHLKEVL